jgi:hypothetical protein
MPPSCKKQMNSNKRNKLPAQHSGDKTKWSETNESRKPHTTSLYTTAVRNANVETNKISCTPNEYELRLFCLPNIYRQKERKLVTFISLQVLSIMICELCETLVDHTYFTHVDLYLHSLVTSLHGVVLLVKHRDNFTYVYITITAQSFSMSHLMNEKSTIF